MQAMDKPMMEKKLPEDSYYVSKKVDGEFNALYYQDGKAFLINPGGTIRAGLPMLEEIQDTLSKAGITSALLAGELYVKTEEGVRERVHEVTRVARNPDDEAALQRLQFAIFDGLESDGQAIAENYAGIWTYIEEKFSQGALCHPVETAKVEKSEEVSDFFDKWVEQPGAEGLVLRSDNSGTYKVKPTHSLDVVVVGFTESVDDRAGLLHDLLMAVMREDGSFHLIGHVGGGFTDEQRRDFLADLQDLVVESEFAEVNKDRVAYCMVKPEWVIEISCLDLISMNTRGASQNKMVINWNSEENKWETLRRLPSVSVISPQFVRRREDKSANVNDVRMKQLSDIVEIENVD